MRPIPTRGASEAAVMPLSSPVDLCRDLRLEPNAGQVVMMLRLSEASGVVDERLTASADDVAEGNVRGDVLRAALMVVLWRVLRVPGGRATVLAPSVPGTALCGELGRLSMAFLAEVCRVQDRGLSESTRIPEWNRLEFGSEAGWTIRLVPNVPAVAAEAARRSHTALVIDAGSPQTELEGASAALEGAFDREKGLLIRLW